ncbi:MAG: YXWGXW repeat-containing protein [Chitinophagales bacterium]|nr:YXWGXW repeat-containing protein [Chitinophagales bacterium]
MKKILFFLSLGVFLLLQPFQMEAQRCARRGHRPATLVVVRPPMPRPGMVWVGGDWAWNRHRGAYVWREGYWAHPPRPRVVYVPRRRR